MGDTGAGDALEKAGAFGKAGVLGKAAPVPKRYAPEVLEAIPRSAAREGLGLEKTPLPFAGEDVWNAWELSWRDADGKPFAALGRLTFPCDTPRLIESKSLKLYLHSLNDECFPSHEAAANRIAEDLSAAAWGSVGDSRAAGGIANGLPAATGDRVRCELMNPDDAVLRPEPLPGDSLDSLRLNSSQLPRTTEPDPGLLMALAEGKAEQCLHTHLFRCLCPVTAQPDWASVLVHCRGGALEPASLLAYLLSYRRYPGFHEHCVERMYLDILRACRPTALAVQALFMRRGGLDINPRRASPGMPRPAPRRSLRQ